MLSDIEKLKKEIESFSISGEEELENFRLKYLSRKGKIQSMFSNIGSVPKEDRGKVGKAMNHIKNFAQQRFEEAEQKLNQKNVTAKATEDITLPAAPLPSGSYHPLTQTLEEMKHIFYRLGFNIADGPEIEDDFIILRPLTSRPTTRPVMSRIPFSLKSMMMPTKMTWYFAHIHHPCKFG